MLAKNQPASLRSSPQLIDATVPQVMARPQACALKDEIVVFAAARKRQEMNSGPYVPPVPPIRATRLPYCPAEQSSTARSRTGALTATTDHPWVLTLWPAGPWHEYTTIVPADAAGRRSRAERREEGGLNGEPNGDARQPSTSAPDLQAKGVGHAPCRGAEKSSPPGWAICANSVGGQIRMRNDWPDGAEVAVSLTFDVDAECGWLGEDPGYATKLSTLSEASYGPTRGLPRILDILEQARDQGHVLRARRHRRAPHRRVKRITDEGHEVGHHGYLHKRSDAIDEDEQREEIERGLEALHTQLDVTPSGYRSPGWELTPRRSRSSRSTGSATTAA